MIGRLRRRGGSAYPTPHANSQKTACVDIDEPRGVHAQLQAAPSSHELTAYSQPWSKAAYDHIGPVLSPHDQDFADPRNSLSGPGTCAAADPRDRAPDLFLTAALQPPCCTPLGRKQTTSSARAGCERAGGRLRVAALPWLVAAARALSAPYRLHWERRACAWVCR